MHQNGYASFRKQIEAYIKEHETRILDDLHELIAFRTVSEEKDELRKSLSWFLQRAEEMGFQTYKTTAGDVGIVEAGQGDETLGILVHLDVVDPGDPEKWKYPPFEGTIADGFLWGRGTMDDKGSAVVCLYGMKALLDLGAVFHKKIWLIVGTAEEEDWTDMAHFKEEFPCPDYGFSPDGDFPIYNIENGYTDMVLEFDESESAGLLGEFDVHSGKCANTIPSKAVFSINGMKQVFEGVSAHSSAPQMGVNAIEKLCASDAVDLPPGADFNFTRFVRDILACDMYGGKLKFKKEEEYWEGQYLGRTTAVPTVLKRAGGKVFLTVNIRQNAALTREDIEKAFDEYSEEYHYRYRITTFLDAMKVSHKRKPFAVMAETYEDWGYQSSFIAAGGTSYAKAMENIVTWGPCFPEDQSCAHQENERIPLSSLFRAMGIYTDYMYRVVSEKDSLL
jgi:succinyl-diaminopimelate desuccinylase